MGAPIRTSSDIPDFSTYPSSPSDQSLSVSEPSARLNEVASQVGSRLGEGMAAVHDLRDRALDRIDSVRSSLDALFCATRDRATEMAQEKFDLVREQSQAQLRRAKQYAEARPLAVIAAAGVAGLLLGIGARAWRENRG
jgi:ElaB/YqjD/DUF883 family membrane-anchored ribosome-binding protein